MTCELCFQTSAFLIKAFSVGMWFPSSTEGVGVDRGNSENYSIEVFF